MAYPNTAAGLGAHIGQPAPPATAFDDAVMAADEVFLMALRVEDVAKRLIGEWPEAEGSSSRGEAYASSGAVNRLQVATASTHDALERIRSALARIEKALP